jgi:nicotinate-nucleotide--dimethylbenzimidazole phosphoribosyltransferase
MQAPATSFEEIRAVTRLFPREDTAMHGEVRQRLANIASAQGGTCFLGNLAFWLAAAQRRSDPQITHPRVALFAATHGIVKDLPEGGAAAMGDLIAALVAENGALNRLASSIDTDLRLYELALDRPCGDSRTGDAMDEAAAAHAIAYGMMAVEPGVDILSIAALGVGASLSAQALAGALTSSHADPLTLLASIGGADIAAMLGAILAARLAGVPVLLDGAAALAAGALAARLSPGGADHCAAASEPDGDTGFKNDLAIESVLRSGGEPPFAGVVALSVLKSAAILLA